jgi:hypothetical protein
MKILIVREHVSIPMTESQQLKRIYPPQILANRLKEAIEKCLRSENRIIVSKIFE